MKVLHKKEKLSFRRVTLLFALMLLALTVNAHTSESLVLKNGNQYSEALEIIKIQKSDPFSAKTDIVLKVYDECRVVLSVCTPMDAVVRQWVLHEVKPGTHIITWDGRNDTGQAVASGVYFFKVQTQQCKHTETLALLK